MPEGCVWPNTYLLGNPKSGSTFLFNCLRSGPFDPNLLYGRDSSKWGTGSYLLTTLGSKKEFNFWGGPGWGWGWDWYLGPPVPLRLWEWSDADPKEVAGEGGARWQRRGENGNGEPSALVDALCRLPESSNYTRAKRRLACRRFPLECIDGTPLVRPGCALVRPLPSRKGCGGARQPRCEMPRVRMSHAWPPVATTSPAARTLDPSINTFMSAPAASAQLMERAPSSGGALRFIVLLREPISRAVSSVRMMREWKWEKSSNASAALHAELRRLHRCCHGLAPLTVGAELGEASTGSRPANDGASGMEPPQSPWRAAANALPRSSDGSLRRFRSCLARGAPLNHLRASVYAAGVLGWLSAGFGANQFHWIETGALRSMSPHALLSAIAAFAGLPSSHLRRLPPSVVAACEAPAGRRGGAGGAARGNGRRLGAAADTRMRTHTHRALPAPLQRQLEDAFRPFNELLGTLLDPVAPYLRNVAWMHPGDGKAGVYI